MTEPGAPAPSGVPRVRTHEVVTLLTVLVFDQITKLMVRQRLPLHDSIEVIPGFFNLTHIQNTGAAFGLLGSAEFPYKTAVMIGIALLALLAIASYAAQLGRDERLARLGLTLILGGALGNLLDRALAGHVVDFIDVYWGTWHFWAFNVADAAISVGAGLVLLDMFGLGRQHASDSV